MQHLTRQLLHLVEVIDQGSLSRAAEELHLTQPALSRSIKCLEDEVNGKLLDRGREGAKATKLGETLYIHGKNIVRSLDRATAEVREWHKKDSGHLIVGASPLPGVYYVPSAIGSYLVENENVAMRFEVHSFSDLQLMLRQGTIDLFVGAMTSEHLPGGIEFTLLFEDEMSIICGPNHPLLDVKDLNYAELVKYPWLLPTKDTDHRRQAEKVFQDIGIANIDIAVETVATAAITPLLTKSHYLTLHSKHLLFPDIESGKLVVLSENMPSSQRMLYAFHRAEDELTALTRGFIEHLKTFSNSFADFGETS